MSSENTDNNQDRRRILLLAQGRGGSGKTMMLVNLIERARRAGRDVRVADLDRTNQSTSHYFADAVTADDASDNTLLTTAEEFVDDLVQNRISGVIDLGGGDLIGPRILHDLDIVTFLSTHGFDVTVLFTLGSDADYLAPYRRLQAMGALDHVNVVFVLNEALADESTKGRAGFKGLLEHPDILQALEAGAEIVLMETLRGARILAENRFLFRDAADRRPAPNGAVLRLIRANHVRKWLKSLEAQLEDFEEKLP